MSSLKKVTAALVLFAVISFSFPMAHANPPEMKVKISQAQLDGKDRLSHREFLNIKGELLLALSDAIEEYNKFGADKIHDTTSLKRSARITAILVVLSDLSNTYASAYPFSKKELFGLLFVLGEQVKILTALDSSFFADREQAQRTLGDYEAKKEDAQTQQQKLLERDAEKNVVSRWWHRLVTKDREREALTNSISVLNDLINDYANPLVVNTIAAIKEKKTAYFEAFQKTQEAMGVTCRFSNFETLVQEMEIGYLSVRDPKMCKAVLDQKKDAN